MLIQQSNKITSKLKYPLSELNNRVGLERIVQFRSKVKYKLKKKKMIIQAKEKYSLIKRQIDLLENSTSNQKSLSIGNKKLSTPRNL